MSKVCQSGMLKKSKRYCAPVAAGFFGATLVLSAGCWGAEPWRKMIWGKEALFLASSSLGIVRLERCPQAAESNKPSDTSVHPPSFEASMRVRFF